MTFDQALNEQLARAHWTRREFLARVAAFGAAAALTQLLVACGQSGSSPSSVPATTAPTPGGTTAAVATPEITAAPTPVPTPEKELYVLNWDGYIGEHTIDKFQEKYGITVTYDNFVDEAGQISKLTSDGKGGGYDISYPASTWMAQFVSDGLVRQIDHSLIPNLKNLSPAWQSPGYDPNNQYSVPNFWWTTGYAWNPKKIKGDLTSWAELWNPAYKGRIYMLDDVRECFAAAAFQLGLSPNTTSTTDLDAILAKLEEQKPLLRDYTTDHVAGFTGGDVDITHCWSGDWVQMIYTDGSENTKYVIPSEGSIKGNDVMIIPSGAPHPIAAHLWIDFNLDGQISADNTNYIGYMGPNDAALPLIDTYITEDPRLNPPAEELAKLIELQYLQPADLDQYTQRWLALKA
ncbi:MAG TPA: spermidine/putrescine ABC transporter substrate-binding protein [Candidatus Limnocylindrales bacterium]|nr:spermidine/putrescine ABC transporter substrate-binding protein [Candidatus Limnocylindrales bacterium]